MPPRLINAWCAIATLRTQARRSSTRLVAAPLDASPIQLSRRRNAKPTPQRSPRAIRAWESQAANRRHATGTTRGTCATTRTRGVRRRPAPVTTHSPACAFVRIARSRACAPPIRRHRLFLHPHCRRRHYHRHRHHPRRLLYLHPHCRRRPYHRHRHHPRRLLYHHPYHPLVPRAMSTTMMQAVGIQALRHAHRASQSAAWQSARRPRATSTRSTCRAGQVSLAMSSRGAASHCIRQRTISIRPVCRPG